MVLKAQNVDGRLTENGIRHLRQYIATGHSVHREDVLALIDQHLADRAELVRLQGVLSTFEREHLADRSCTWSEGWVAGSDAVLRQFPMTAEERLLALTTAAGFEENPYAAQLDAPIVEGLPDAISEVPC